jgi:hypothetical protein
MGINASIYRLIKKEPLNSHSEEYTFFEKEQLKHLKSFNFINKNFDKNMLLVKEILFIGDNDDFKKEVFENYEINDGIFSIEEGINYLKTNVKIEIIKELEKQTYTNYDTLIQDETLFLSLDC